MRSSKDLAKRLRFDWFPRPNFFRRWYFMAAVAAAGVGLGAWLFFSGALGERQYLPGPVSQNHATFGDRCETCHTTSFASVQNEACLACHGERVHSEFERDTPPCRTCHVEHRHADVFLAVGNESCVECHGALVSTRPQPILETKLPTFAAHPPFAPIRDGHNDAAAIRFNHKIHLTSDRVNEKLRCRDCHRPERDGGLMQPIVFERHCRRCHEQKVDGPAGAVEALHETPDIIRPDLGAKLLVMAVDNADEIFEGRENTLPGRVDRAPIDASRSLAEYQRKWTAKVEAALYAPINDTPPLLDNNRYCFLCHVEDGQHAAGDLPQIKQTAIPHRWLTRAMFSHRPHDTLPCETCHANAAQSAITTDTNLPRNDTCLQCHVDGMQQSAGTNCMLCHLYHDTSKDPALRALKRKELSIEKLKGG